MFKKFLIALLILGVLVSMLYFLFLDSSSFLVLAFGLFVMCASCYILFMISDPLEEVGTRLGKLLKVPEDVIASTFAAVATSGPEIVMAIIAASPFIVNEVWKTLELGERACSGTLNMAFSAMDNLLGIGAVAIVFLIKKGKVDKNDTIPILPTTVIGLGFYIIASGALSLFIRDGIIQVWEAWFLAATGMAFVLTQFIVPFLVTKFKPIPEEFEEEDDEEEEPIPTMSVSKWTKEMVKDLFIYAFLIFALIVFVRETLAATFNMATVGLVSLGGVLIMFTSYVSSFPEFMMSYRFVISNKKGALLGMLFGSNVIDLAFAGFRAMYRHEPMSVYTTGKFPELLPYYIWTLPAIAILILISLVTNKLKWKYAYPMIVFYLFYIVSGFVLL